MVAIVFTVDHILSSVLTAAYTISVLLQWCNHTAHRRIATRYALLADHQQQPTTTLSPQTDDASITVPVDDGDGSVSRSHTDPSGSGSASRRAPSSSSSSSSRRRRKPARVGQMHREMMMALLPAAILLCVLAVDPIGVYDIWSPVVMDLLYFNLSTTVFMGVGIILASTVRIHLVVVRSLAVERARRLLNWSLIIMLGVIPFVSGNVCALAPLLTPEEEEEGIHGIWRGSHLLALFGGLFFATIAYNWFAIQLARAMRELSTANNNNNPALPSSPTTAATHDRSTSSSQPSTNTTGSPMISATAHAALASSLKRFERFRLIFNILSFLALAGQGFFGYEAVIHPSQSDTPDPEHFNTQALRPMLFHYLQILALALGQWLAWVKLRYGVCNTATICCRRSDDIILPS